VVNVTTGHCCTEDSREAREELGLSATWKASTMPATVSTHLFLQPALQRVAIAAIVNEVDVSLVDGTVAWRIDDERATWTTTASSGCIHATVIVVDVASVDALSASAGTPHLVAALIPASSKAVFRSIFLVPRSSLPLHGVAMH